MKLTAEQIKSLYAPTAIVAVMFLILCGLGTWQMQRLQWKSAILRQVEDRQALPLATLDPRSDVDNMLFRTVMVRGALVSDKVLFFNAGAVFKEPGYFVISPFVFDSGEVIFVNRGWIPVTAQWSNESSHLASLTGRLMPLRSYEFLMPENKPDENIWFWHDMAAMMDFVGFPQNTVTLPMIVHVLPIDDDTTLPIPTQPVLNMRNAHLEYALTWYLLAATLLGVYGWAIYNRFSTTP